MYEIIEQATISGDVAIVWAVATDVDRWPTWDPHEEGARLDGPFAPGTCGWSKPHGAPAAGWTLTDVQEQRAWASECDLPGGTLVSDNVFEPVVGGRVRCTKTVRITGPLVLLFRLYFGPRMRRDMRKSWVALEREVARRAGIHV